MSGSASTSNIVVVDTESALISFLDDVGDPPKGVPHLFLDLEGISLGRHGSISIVSIFLAPKNTAYLISVHTLGARAFSTTNAHHKSLTTILQSPIIPKVIFDVRNDSDALYSGFGIAVAGIKDLQLMELATRIDGRQTFVYGLAKCIDKHSLIPAAEQAQWKAVKEAGGKLFDPERGGSYSVFNESPLRPEIVAYCAQDVSALPGLYSRYSMLLKQGHMRGWRHRVDVATEDRIVLSQSADYDPNGPNKARSPW